MNGFNYQTLFHNEESDRNIRSDCDQTDRSFSSRLLHKCKSHDQFLNPKTNYYKSLISKSNYLPSASVLNEITLTNQHAYSLKKKIQSLCHNRYSRAKIPRATLLYDLPESKDPNSEEKKSPSLVPASFRKIFEDSNEECDTHLNKSIDGAIISQRLEECEQIRKSPVLLFEDEMWYASNKDNLIEGKNCNGNSSRVHFPTKSINKKRRSKTTSLSRQSFKRLTLDTRNVHSSSHIVNDASDEANEDSCQETDVKNLHVEFLSPSYRNRKISVFEKIGNLFSLGSMPDLSKVKLNLKEKFHKSAIKKKSV